MELLSSSKNEPSSSLLRRACSGDKDGSSNTWLHCTGSVPKLISLSDKARGLSVAGDPAGARRISVAGAVSRRGVDSVLSFPAACFRFSLSLVVGTGKVVSAATGWVSGSRSARRGAGAFRKEGKRKPPGRRIAKR